ncbi:MAG TPA: glycosyltransferase [Solirubrobacterales bacterium]|nr:glycosyltransferase [Solirubrobacterales bacterium]
MRVGILTSALGGGGAERQSLIWARTCVERGHEVTAISLWNHAHIAVDRSDLRLIEIPKHGASDLARIAWRLRKLERELDVLVAFEPYLAFCCALAHLRIPWMLVTGKVPNQLAVDSGIPMRAYRWAFDRATLASAPSRGMIDSHLQTGLRPNKPWALIPNVTDPAAFVERDGPGSGILFVGRLATVKNPVLAIEAAAAVPAPLTLLGEGELQGEVEAALAARGEGPAVEILPFSGQPWSAYASHRVLVVSSHYESFGNVIVEALAAGTPVVSVDCDFGPREIIGEATYSTLTESSPEAIAGGLREVLERPYSEAEATECHEIASRYRPEAVSPLIVEAVEGLRN